MIEKHDVHHCHVDNGSSIDILYNDAFENIEINPKQLRLATYAFIEDAFIHEG